MKYILTFIIFLLIIFVISNNKYKKNICICMLYTPNIASYSKITEKINKLYAYKYNYSFKTYYKRFANDRAPQWDKIQAILTLMKEKYDYILWIDADAYINDHNERLEEIFNFDDNYNIHIGSDKPYGIYNINTGIMLVKNNEWSKKFLQKIWDCDQKKFLYEPYHEQAIFDILYNKNEMDSQNKVKIYESYIFNNNNPNSSSFIIHMMQQKEKFRIYHSTNKLKNLITDNFAII